jgi:hypothetical protein
LGRDADQKFVSHSTSVNGELGTGNTKWCSEKPPETIA